MVLDALDECGISYMITGSFAGNVHGVPRATQDADVIIEAHREGLNAFLDMFTDTFYVSSEAVQQALETQGMFNIIHLETGFKVDLIVRKARPFSREEFSRRRRLPFLGRSVWFASAEDIILAKLEWSKMGSSERQFNDALNVAKIQGKTINQDYLNKWAQSLGVQDLLKQLLAEMKE